MSSLTEIAGQLGEASENENCEKFLVFSILGKLYAFPSCQIGEITMFEVVYPLPLVPSYVLGVVNRYSVPYALFDIGLLFHQTQTPRNKILVFKDEIDRVAVLIDDITGIIDIDRENIYHIEKSANFDLSDAVVSSFNWNNTDIFVLDIHRILESVSREIV